MQPQLFNSVSLRLGKNRILRQIPLDVENTHCYIAQTVPT